MSRTKAEVHFRRFQKKGKAEDLAAVFDHTAPELLRVASHLTQDLHAAEDLVQATFLAAIQHRNRYEPRSSVVAWLTGILVNRAHMLRRENARQPDPDRLDRSEPQTPEKIAQGQELSKTVSDAIAGLPEIYRPVLNLHLRNGLNAREIALALERPPGTVRTQLLRGMEMLRRALPAGLAGGVASIASSRGLAAIRTTVLDTAAEVAPPATSTTAVLGGLLLMKKLLLVPAGLLAAGALAWMAWPNPTPEFTAQDTLDPTPVSQVAQVTEASTDAESSPADLRREQLASAPAWLDQPVELRGRCLDVETGLPLQGLSVLVTGTRLTRASREYEAEHGPIQWQDPPTVTTGPDGAFSVRFAPPPTYRIRLEIRGTDRLSLYGSIRDLSPGEIRDFGDLSMVPGATVGGRVVDTEGNPQPGVSVRLDGLPFYGNVGEIDIRHRSSVETDGGGNFAFPDPIPRGSWEVYVFEKHLAQPVRLGIGRSDRSKTLDIRLKRAEDIETITGVVVDQFGAAVEGADLRPSSRGSGRAFNIDTDQNGRFRIERGNADSPDPSRITVTKTGYEVLRTEESYSWGTENLRLVLFKGLDLEVVVTEAVTGEPVESFGVRRFPDPRGNRGWSSTYGRPQQRGTHDDGRLRVSGVPRGPNMLLVEPEPPYLPSEFLRFEMTDRGAPPQRVALVHPTEVTLQVSHANGEPVADTKVQLLRPVREESVDIYTWQTYLDDLNFPSPLGDRNWSLVLQEASTDESGKLRLYGPSDRKLAVAVLVPNRGPEIFNDILLSPEEPTLQLRLSEGATITGKLTPSSVLDHYRPTRDDLIRLQGSPDSMGDYLPGVILQRDLHQPAPGRPPVEVYPVDARRRVPLNEDGTFMIQGIPPGTWDLQLAYVSFGTLSSSMGHEPLITGLALREGESKQLDVDIGPLRRARLNGTLLLNGRPFPNANVQFLGNKPDGTGGTRRVGAQGRRTSDLEGRFTVDLMPASFRIRVYASPLPGLDSTLIPHAEEIVALPGEQIEKTFHLVAAKMHLRVLGSDGTTPLEGIAIYGRMPEPDSERTWYTEAAPTDREGRTELPHVPSGTLTLQAHAADLTSSEARSAYRREHGVYPDPITLKTLHVDAGSGEITVELVMPKGSGY